MEKHEISFVLMLRKKTAICYQANFKRNVYDQNFYWGGGSRDGEWGGGNSERCLKWGGGDWGS